MSRNRGTWTAFLLTFAVTFAALCASLAHDGTQLRTVDAGHTIVTACPFEDHPTPC